MRTTRFSVVLLLLISLSLSATAHTGSISGRIIDNTGKPLSLVSVLLLNASDSVLVKTELTDEKGEYHLTPSADGNFVVRVSLMGYEGYTSAPVAINGGNVTLPGIMLLPRAAMMNEVAVRAQKPFVEVHADKLVVNVESSIVSAGSNALEVLARSPGVTVNNNDNISLKGKQGVTVMINGKIQPISGEDLANMLKSMPASAVETIELISNPPAKYDAAGTAGIINIKLKRDRKMGLNGSVNTTYAQGVYGKANASMNINYRTQKLNLNANYNYSNRVGFNNLTLKRNFFENGTFTGAYEQDNTYLYDIKTDMGVLSADYSLSSATTIGGAVSGEHTYFRRDGNNFSRVIDPDTTKQQSHFVTQNSSPNNWGNRTANFNLRHNFDTAGQTLAVDADYAAYPTSGRQDYTTRYYHDLTDGTIVPAGVQPLQFHGDLAGITQIRSVKADYSRPMSNGVKMDAGVKMSYVTAENDLKFYNYKNSKPVTDSNRTNNFLYREQINAAYINVGKEYGKWSTQIGLRAEQTIASGDATTPVIGDSTFTRNYAQLFPSLAVQRHINAHNDLGLTLSRRIERPNYDQLNPATYYLDPTSYKTGYPYLNPALSYAAELSHTWKQKFITNLSYTHTTAPITEVLQPSATESKVTIQTQKNLSSMSYFGVSGSYQIRVCSWWNNTTNVNIYYAHYTGNIAGTNLSAGKATFDANTSNSFVLPHSWSAEVGGFYQAPQVYGYMNLKPSWMLNMGLQKNLFDKRATARINVVDMFWRGYPRGTSYYNSYNEWFSARRDTRQVAVSFTYRFGTRTLAPAGRHRSGAEDEKRRAGSQTG